MKRNIGGKIMIVAGTVLIGSALSIILYNRNESVQAGIKSEQVIKKLDVQRAMTNNNNVSEDDKYQYSGEDGIDFAGILSISELNIQLPVCSEFSMSSLSGYPCIYSGSVSERNIIIAAHNYDSHFGNIRSLDKGDRVTFRTPSGKEFFYEVFSIDIISGSDTEKMISGEWDLTLFTCTRSGTDRITVRCSEVKEV